MKTLCTQHKISTIYFYKLFGTMLAMTLMLLHLSSGHLHAAQATLAWDPPVNADETPFTAFTGYKLYAGAASGNYNQTIDVGNTTTYTLGNLSDGATYYFAVTDYDGSGNASGYSNEVSKTFPYLYSLTATAGAGGTITPVGSVTSSTATNGTSTITSVTVSQGATQSFSIAPNSGYTIAAVTVDGISAGAVTSYTFTSITANHTLSATFAAIPATYTLSASAGTGGSVTPSGIATVNSGTSQSYTITPASGYTIAGVTIDGVSMGAVANYTFTNVTANHTLSATFATIPATYTLSASAGTGGGITPSGITTVNSGTGQSYTITPTSGYKIANVTVDGVSVGAVASYSFTNVIANHTITATFSAITYSITATAGTGGSITPSGIETVNSGAGQNYTIAPTSGYKIANVTVDGVSVGAVTSYSFTNVTASHTIAATFTVMTYSITATAGAGGSITPSGIATVNSGASQSYAIAPASGYTIADVKVDGISVGAIANYTFSTVTANHTITATFSVITYSMSATAGTGGSITPSGTSTVNSGSSQSYTIAPASGYTIAGVTVDGVSVGTVASYTFATVTANHTIAATFSVITYSMSATAGTGGSITPSGTSTVNSGSSQSYTIAPASGYIIAGITVDGVSVGAVASYTFTTVTANHSIAATFSVITYSLTASAGTGGIITPSGITTVNSGAGKSYTITPISGYKINDVTVDGVSVGAVASYSFTNVIANHTLTAIFAKVIPTLVPSSGIWQNQTISPQSSVFTVKFDTIPTTNNIDALSALSALPVNTFTDGAAIIRFNSSGAFDVRNGNTYAADMVVPYSAGKTYHIRMTVNVLKHVYNVYVTPPGMSEVILANGYAFRTEQATVTILNNLGIFAGIGSHQVLNFTVSPLVSYSISSSFTAGGSITPTGIATVNSGGSQTSIITPSSGYKIADVTVDKVSVGAVTSYIFTNVTANHTISAKFAKDIPFLVTSSGIWQNQTFSPQRSVFTVNFDTIPTTNNMDALSALSALPVNTFTDGAAIIRFNSTGAFDVRNGNVYAADMVVPYSAGKNYHIRMTVNVLKHVYNVYVTPPGGSEILLANGYAFRAEQATVDILNNLGIFTGIGSHQVLNFSVSPPA